MVFIISQRDLSITDKAIFLDMITQFFQGFYIDEHLYHYSRD